MKNKSINNKVQFTIEFTYIRFDSINNASVTLGFNSLYEAKRSCMAACIASMDFNDRMNGLTSIMVTQVYPSSEFESYRKIKPPVKFFVGHVLE